VSGVSAAASARPFCAVHPEVPALMEPCTRCGAFACEDCFGLTGPKALSVASLCRGCRERVGQGGEVPWEDLSLAFGNRLGQTLTRALTAPGPTFEAIGEGHLYHAGTFAFVTTLIGYAPIIALFGLAAMLVLLVGESLGLESDVEPVVSGVLCFLPFLVPIFVLGISIVVDLFFAVVFHVTAKLLGGKGSFEGSLRGTLYTSAVRVVLAPLTIAGFIPLIGPLISLATRIGMLIWISLALGGTARRVHRLEPSSAMLAGAMPAIVIVALTIGLGILVLGLAMSDGLDDLDID
jgi:hypothetical protein